MMRRYLLAVLFLTATTAVAQDYDWLVGNWDVSYDDAILGKVRGRAKVDVKTDGWVHIQYFVTDPRDASVHELTPFHIRLTGDVLTMELPVGGPSGATTASDSATGAAESKVIVLGVPVGVIRAALGEIQHQARVGGNPSVANPRLRMVRKGERLVGEWIVRRDSETGFKDARMGTPGTEPIPGPPPGVHYDVMRGPEVWESSFMAIEGARRQSWEAAKTPGTNSGTMRITILGKNLPTASGRQGDVRIADSLLKPDLEVKQYSEPEGLTLPVDIDRSAVPGRKTFTVLDPGSGQQGLGEWLFDWPPLRTNAIYHARKSPGGTYEPTRVLYNGEQFYVEAEAAADDSGHARLYLLETDSAEPIFFHLLRDRENRRKFRAGPFLLLSPDEPATQMDADAAREFSPVEAPTELDLDSNELIIASPSRPFLVRASPESRIRTAPATALPGDWATDAYADVAEEEVGEGRYQRALEQAREFRKLYPGDERYVIAKFQPIPERGTGFSRRSVVTEADHAALIVLHDEITRQVNRLRRLHARVFSRAELDLYGAALTESVRTKVEEPLFRYQVPAPGRKELVHLNGAVHWFNLQQWFGADEKKKQDYLAEVIPIASTQLVTDLVQAKIRLDQIDLSKPEELLRAVKPAYGAVYSSLAQTLVRRSRPSQGEPAEPRWIPDEPGRVAVRGVADLLGAIASDEYLASYQWTWLNYVAAPLAFVGGGSVAQVVLAIELLDSVDRLREARERSEVARDLIPITGYEAYRSEQEAANAAMLSTVVLGAAMGAIPAAHALSTGRDLARSLRVPSAAYRSAVTQALEQGIDSLTPTARSNFAVVLDSAARRAATEGASALTALERKALRAAFPSGVPEDLASALKISKTDPDFVIKLGDSTMDLAAQSRPARRPAVPEAPPVDPQRSSNPLIRRMYGEAEDTARLGTSGAQERLARLERAAATWETLPPAARGKVQEAMETFQRLRRENPAVAALDETEALEYFNLHSQRSVYSADFRSPVNRPLQPEELASEFVAWNRVKVTPEQLSRAANVSVPNAEAAVFAAESRAAVGLKPPSSPRPRLTDPDAETIGDGPRRPAPEPAPQPQPRPAAETGWDEIRRVEIAERLKQMGVPANQAEVAAIVPAGRGGDVRAAAARAAMQSGVPAERVMQQMRVNRQQLEAMLDDYLRRFELTTDAQRKYALSNYFGDRPPADPVPPAVGAPRPPADAPPGLSAPAPSPQSARQQVKESLGKMGLSQSDIELLPLDEVIRKSGGRPQEVAAGLAHQAGIDSRTAARALGTDEKGFAGLVDRFDAASRPHVPANQRAAEIAGRLEADGVTQPFTKVLQARQDSVNAALRDLGIAEGDAGLIKRGLDPESAIVGEALERGVSREVIESRRGLTPQRLDYHADDYLFNGRGVTAPAERARQRTELLSRPPTEGGTSTVRLPPQVIAAEHELADALELLGVDRVTAASRANKLANVARADAHEAIVVGAWQSRAPPSAIRQQFGLTNEQMARRMDHYLENYLGMRDPAARHRFIAENFFGRHGEGVTPDAVGGMISTRPQPPPPLRARTTANPPPAPLPPPPPPPRPLTSNPTPGDLTARFGPARTPQMGLRLEERLPGGGVRTNPGVREARAGEPLMLNPGVKHLWLIDERGRLLIAPERYAFDEAGRVIRNAAGEPGRLGHPAMINGGPVRIAGELRYVEGRGWVLDNISGRYSMLNRDMRFEHLQNAAQLFGRSGLRVRVNYYEPPG